jgi:hypothetical protein
MDIETKCRKYLIAFVMLGASVCTAPAVARDVATVRAAFERAEAALSHHSDGFAIDDDPQAPALLRQEWSVTGEWAADYLTAHPAASEAELVAAIRELSPNLTAESIKLDPTTFLVSAYVDEIGTVFIVSARGDRFAQAWTIADAAAHRPIGFDVLGAWSADKARGNCRQSLPQKAWNTCGPVFGSIGKIPNQEDGSPRFYIDGTYAQGAGATVGAQLSLWKWTGLTAELLYAKTYGYMIDQAVGTRLDGNFLRVRVKDKFGTFFACGSCEGRQMDWTLRIDPDRIEDLGRKSVVPELDLIDSLYARLIEKKPVTDIADPAVVEALKPVLAGLRKRGMLMDWKVTGDGPRRVLCISTENGGAYLFTIDSMLSRPRVVAASAVPVVSEEECGGSE